MRALLEKERLYQKALELCPTYPEAANNLGDVYENMGRYAEAVAEYERAIDLKKDSPVPYFGLGDIYFKSGNYREAIRLYDGGLALDPTDRIAKERRMQAEALLGKRLIPREKIIEVLRSPQTRGAGDVVKITFGSDRQKGLIPFDYDKYNIREDAKPQLRELGEALSSPQLAQYAFEIGGHTDKRGSDAYNQELSLKRAMAVRDYLVTAFRISPGRLVAKAYGKGRLLALGDDEASHAINRRVEVIRLDGAGKGSGLELPRDNQRRLSLDLGFLYKDKATGRRVHIRDDGKTVLRTGEDPYQIFFRAYQTCYVYLLQKDAAGKWYVLFPGKASDGVGNPAGPARDYWVPGFERGFLPDKTPGVETIYLLASSWQLPELESTGPEIEKMVISITRGFQTRGLLKIGAPQTASSSTHTIDHEATVRNLQGRGGFVRIITFVHE